MATIRLEEQTDQNPDNRDRDEQFDEGKTVRTGKAGTPNAAPSFERAETASAAKPAERAENGTESAVKPAERAETGIANAATSSARRKSGVNLGPLQILGAALKFNFRRPPGQRRRRRAVKIARNRKTGTASVAKSSERAETGTTSVAPTLEPDETGVNLSDLRILGAAPERNLRRAVAERRRRRAVKIVRNRKLGRVLRRTVSNFPKHYFVISLKFKNSTRNRRTLSRPAP